MAIGEIGMSLRDFYSLTYNEYHYVAKGYMYKDEREWQRMRLQTTFLLNVQMASDKNITPEQLIRLPSDNIDEDVVIQSLPTKEDFDELVEKYSKISRG